MQPEEIEIWQDVPGFSSRYEVSNLGNVRNKGKGNILRPFDRKKNRSSGSGYLSVHLTGVDGVRFVNKTVHSLVMLAFRGERPEDFVIHHKDFNKANNKLSNLEYCTQSQNAKYDYDGGNRKIVYGEDTNGHILSDSDVLSIVDMYYEKRMTVKDILLHYYFVTESAIYGIITGRTWGHLTSIDPTTSLISWKNTIKKERPNKPKTTNGSWGFCVTCSHCSKLCSPKLVEWNKLTGEATRWRPSAHNKSGERCPGSDIDAATINYDQKTKDQLAPRRIRKRKRL